MISLFSDIKKKQSPLASPIDVKSKSSVDADKLKSESPYESIIGSIRTKTGIDFNVKDPIGNIQKIQEAKAPSDGFIPLTKTLYNRIAGRARAGGRPSRLFGRKK